MVQNFILHFFVLATNHLKFVLMICNSLICLRFLFIFKIVSNFRNLKFDIKFNSLSKVPFTAVVVVPSYSMTTGAFSSKKLSSKLSVIVARPSEDLTTCQL